jgi:hypothetical protein
MLPVPMRIAAYAAGAQLLQPAAHLQFAPFLPSPRQERPSSPEQSTFRRRLLVKVQSQSCAHLRAPDCETAGQYAPAVHSLPPDRATITPPDGTGHPRAVPARARRRSQPLERPFPVTPSFLSAVRLEPGDRRTPRSLRYRALSDEHGTRPARDCRGTPSVPFLPTRH